MARHDEEEINRFAQLEASIVLHRKMLTVVMAFLLVIATAVITYGVVKLLEPKTTYLQARDLAKLESHMDIIKQAAVNWQNKVKQLEVVMDSSNTSAFKTMMLEQEQSFQDHLQALKVGMADLARMVPGSRTWLDTYSEQMDAAIAHSKARSAKLARIQTSELPHIEAEEIRLPPLPVHVQHAE